MTPAGKREEKEQKVGFSPFPPMLCHCCLTDSFSELEKGKWKCESWK